MRKLISGVFHLVGVLMFSALLLLAGAAAGAGCLLYLAYEHDPKIASKVDRTAEILRDAIEKSQAVWRIGEQPRAAFEDKAHETMTAGEPDDAVTLSDGHVKRSETVAVPAEVQLENAVDEISVGAARPKTDSAVKGIEKVD